MKLITAIMIALVATVAIVTGNPVEDTLAKQGLVAEVNMVGETYMVYSETTDSPYYLGALVGFMSHSGKDVEIHVTNITEQQTYVVTISAQQGKTMVASAGNEEAVRRVIRDIYATMTVGPANVPTGKFDKERLAGVTSAGIGMVASQPGSI